MGSAGFGRARVEIGSAKFDSAGIRCVGHGIARQPGWDLLGLAGLVWIQIGLTGLR